jgi:hypothetical protein
MAFEWIAEILRSRHVLHSWDEYTLNHEARPPMDKEKSHGVPDDCRIQTVEVRRSCRKCRKDEFVRVKFRKLDPPEAPA